MNLIKYQNNMNNILKSATRTTMIILIITLCAMLFMTLKGDKFSIVFELFQTVTVGVISFFFGKSTQESTGQKEVVKEDTNEPLFKMEL
jgi:hypothetical protein